ncbi:MAG: RNA methyltransferase [Patescibacteria group bacterium]
MPTKHREARIKNVVARREAGLVVVLEDIFDPHNAGAIFRTCDALGIQEAHLVFKSEKRFNPRRVGRRSSSSANKWLTFHVYASIRDCIGKLRRRGYEIVATALDGEAENLYNAKFKRKKIALLVGNEHRGLSKEAIALASRKIMLPMRGMVESLNVSVSTAIFLYEIVRSRTSSHLSRKLSYNESKHLLKELLER